MAEIKKGKLDINILNIIIETLKIFNFYKNSNFNIILLFQEKIINGILRIPFIETSEEICELLFNNKDLTETYFTEYSYLISKYFAYILIKFNNIKEKEYFKKLMTKIVSIFSKDNIIIAFNKFNENIFDNHEPMQFFLKLLVENFRNLKHID